MYLGGTTWDAFIDEKGYNWDRQDCLGDSEQTAYTWVWAEYPPQIS